jgi:hypothetical protein
LITALVNRAVKLRFTWFATVGFIRCFAHPIRRKIELTSLIIYFGMKPLETDGFLIENGLKMIREDVHLIFLTA